MTPEIMKPVWAGALAFVLVGPAAAEMQVSFPTSDGGLLNADQYRKGARGVVLARWTFQPAELGKTGAVAGEHGISRPGPRFPRRRPVTRRNSQRSAEESVRRVGNEQLIWQTDRGEHVMNEILRFLSEP